MEPGALPLQVQQALSALRALLLDGALPDDLPQALKDDALFQELVQLATATPARRQAARRMTEALMKEPGQPSVRDPLTGCFTRHYLDESLHRELARAERDGYPISIILCDIDFFKLINETFGRSVGDRVLQNIGRMLQDYTRASDIVCRYGGEEFMVVLVDAWIEDAMQRAEKLRRMIQEHPLTDDDTQVHLTVSIGVASFPDHGRQIGVLVSAAEKALLLAKQTGRNLVVRAK